MIMVLFDDFNASSECRMIIFWLFHQFTTQLYTHAIGSVHPSESDTIAAFQGEKVESQLDEKGNVFNTLNSF